MLGGDFTDELFEAAWASRKGQEVKEPELLASHFLHDIDREDLDLESAEMAADWDELQLLRQRAARRQAQEPSVDVAPSGASASSGANQAVADNRQRRFVTYMADGLSQVEADLLLPPLQRFSKIAERTGGECPPSSCQALAPRAKVGAGEASSQTMGPCWL